VWKDTSVSSISVTVCCQIDLDSIESDLIYHHPNQSQVQPNHSTHFQYTPTPMLQTQFNGEYKLQCATFLYSRILHGIPHSWLYEGLPSQLVM